MRRMINLAVIFVAAPLALPEAASATVFDVNIFADVTGTDTRAACGPGQTFPFCPVETLPYANSLALSLGPTDLVAGDNAFTYGGIFTTGLVTGTISYADGLLTGRDLTYTYAACSGPCAGDQIFATAATFVVSGRALGAVPEPATWAMMLVGVGAVGAAMRRKQGFAIKAA